MIPAVKQKIPQARAKAVIEYFLFKFRKLRSIIMENISESLKILDEEWKMEKTYLNRAMSCPARGRLDGRIPLAGSRPLGGADHFRSHFRWFIYTCLGGRSGSVRLRWVVPLLLGNERVEGRVFFKPKTE